MPTPEVAARRNIDAALQSAGWHVQDFAEFNLAAGPGVAVREFPLTRGHGKADYARYVAGKLAGVKDESLEDSANLPAPEVIAGEIVDDLRAAREQSRRSRRTSRAEAGAPNRWTRRSTRRLPMLD